MFCEEWTKVKRIGHVLQAEPLFCRSWRCPECAPRRLRQLFQEAKSGAPNTFITVTSRVTDTMSAEEARVKLAWAWKTALKRISRRYKREVPAYFVVVERTGRGWPHFHILLRSTWIDQAYLSNIMKELIDSPIVDIRRVQDVKRALKYVAKYIAKEPAQWGRMKRYWFSKGYKLPDTSRSEFERSPWDSVQVIKHGIEAWAATCRALGFEVQWNETHTVCAAIHPRAGPGWS